MLTKCTNVILVGMICFIAHPLPIQGGTNKKTRKKVMCTHLSNNLHCGNRANLQPDGSLLKRINYEFTENGTPLITNAFFITLLHEYINKQPEYAFWSAAGYFFTHQMLITHWYKANDAYYGTPHHCMTPAGKFAFALCYFMFCVCVSHLIHLIR